MAFSCFFWANESWNKRTHSPDQLNPLRSYSIYGSIYESNIGSEWKHQNLGLQYWHEWSLALAMHTFVSARWTMINLNGDFNMFQLVSTASWHHRQYLNLPFKRANNGDILVTYKWWTSNILDITTSKRWCRSLPKENNLSGNSAAGQPPGVQGSFSSMSWPFDALASSPTSWSSLVPFSGCLTSWVPGSFSSMPWPFDALASSPTSWNSLVPFSGCLTSWVAPLGSTSSSSSSSLSLLTWIKFLSPALTAAGPLTPCPRRAGLALGCRGGICWRTRSPRRSKSCLEGISKPKAWTRLKSLFMPILILQSKLTAVSHMNGDGMKSYLELETTRLTPNSSQKCL